MPFIIVLSVWLRVLSSCLCGLLYELSCLPDLLVFSYFVLYDVNIFEKSKTVVWKKVLQSGII